MKRNNFTKNTLWSFSSICIYILAPVINKLVVFDDYARARETYKLEIEKASATNKRGKISGSVPTA